MPNRRRRQAARPTNNDSSDTDSMDSHNYDRSRMMMTTCRKVFPNSQDIFLHQLSPQRSTVYYASLELSYQNTLSNKLATIIQIGDVVAVADTSTTTCQPTEQEKNIFPNHPYWRPAQVLALYQHHDTSSSNSDNDNESRCWCMTLRWFYRYAEIQDESVKFALVDELQRDERSMEVYESTTITTDVNLLQSSASNTMVVGKVQLRNTSDDVTKEVAQGRGTADDGMPQVTLVCRSRIYEDKDEVVVEAVDDWDTNLPSTANEVWSGPLERGLACLDNPNLIKATKQGLLEYCQEEDDTTGNEEQMSSSSSEADSDSSNSVASASSEIGVERTEVYAAPSSSDSDEELVGRQENQSSSDDESSDTSIEDTMEVAGNKEQAVVNVDDNESDDDESDGQEQEESEVEESSHHIAEERESVQDTNVSGSESLAESNNDGEGHPMSRHVEHQESSESDSPSLDEESRESDIEREQKMPQTDNVSFDDDAEMPQYRPDDDLSDDCGQSMDEDEESSESEEELSDEETCNSEVDKEMTADSEKLERSHGNGNRTYYDCISLAIRSDACAPRVVSKARSRGRWTVMVGDMICLEYEDASPRDVRILDSFKRKASPQARLWFPFVVPLVVCQVLTIYRDKRADNRVMLEVRWCYRASDLPKFVRARLPVEDSEASREQVFETDNVETGLPASDILGHIDVFLGHHAAAGNLRPDTESIPTVECRCSQFFLTQESLHQLQPIFSSGLTPKEWYRRSVLRGASLSKNLQLDEILRRSTLKLLRRVYTIPTQLLDLEAGDVKETSEKDPEYGNIVEATLEPRWDCYYLADLLWHPEDRKGLHWNLTVGDLVAIQNENASPPAFQGRDDKMWYPFNIGWSPAQVLAIFDTDMDHLRFEIRWFKQINDFPGDGPFNKNVLKLSDKLKLDAVCESGETAVIDSDRLVGPLTIRSPENQTAAQSKALPQKTLIYGGQYYPQSGKALVARSWSWADVISRGIDYADHYSHDAARERMKLLVACGEESSDEVSLDQSTMTEASLSCSLAQHRRPGCNEKPTKRARLDWVATEDIAPQEDDGSRSDTQQPLQPLNPDEIQVWTSLPPFHVDVSSRRAYYSEMNISPPYEHYVFGRSRISSGAINECWKVKLGDSVIVRYEVGSGMANFDAAHMNKNAHFPFKLPWAVGEILTIWKEHDMGDDSSQSHVLVDDAEPRHEENIMIEIRWYYRHDELLGASRSLRKAPVVASSSLEEIFESDHIEEDWEASNILAPAVVSTSLTRSGVAPTHVGMPLIEMFCSRFFSLHRRSMVPCGDSSNRMERGRLLSKHFGKNGVLKAALERHLQPHNPTKNDDLDNRIACDTVAWRVPFQEAIGKLSLTDSADDAAAKGNELPGREKEMERIKSFLRNAICDQPALKSSESTGSAKSSMFVAGPPGTGKTASVRSTIAQLRHEQASGDIPAFDFISLNGMEMRHPFEAYVRLWEEVSGVAREKKGPEVAAALLEKHFTGNHQYESGADPDHRIVVVLLDEIDYLVTKKQTVLYNFFDWPIRASQTPHGPRLVVIGISNTLNLPSRLKQSVQSRLGKERCDFKAYNHQHIVKILSDKVNTGKKNSYKVFDDDAILFAAKKTASLSGDLRKALQLCKTAAENVLKAAEAGTWVDPQGKITDPIVRVKHVHTASRESFGSILSKALALTSPFEALLLISLASLSRSTGRENGGFDIDELYTKIEAIANASGDPLYLAPPTFGEILEILNRLGESRLVSLSTPKSSAISFRAAQGGSGGAWPLISLPMDSSTIMLALRDTPHQSLADKYLGTQGSF